MTIPRRTADDDDDDDDFAKVRSPLRMRRRPQEAKGPWRRRPALQ